MSRPKTNIVKLTDDEVEQLKRLQKKKDTSKTVSSRCKILLAMDENHPPIATYEQCMARCDVSRGMIAATIKSFCIKGLEETLKLKRNVNSDNSRRKVDGRTEAKLIQLACGPVPEGHSRWTIRLLEKEIKIIIDEPISREAIRRTLKKTGLDLTDPNTGVCHQKQMQNS